MEDTLYSTITTSLKRRVLMRGILLALPGASLMLYMGTMVSSPILQKWGFLVFALGIFFIAVGLIPYRRLCRMETNPHEIRFSETMCKFFMRGKVGFELPLDNIDDCTLIEKGLLYGLGIDLKNPELLPPHLKRYRDRCQKQLNTDLFLPYFRSRDAFMNNVMHANQSDKVISIDNR